MIFLTVNIHGQPTTNELTTAQYNNIKVNGILKTAIEATHGDITQMNVLIGSIASTSEAEGGIGGGYRNFSYYGGDFHLTFTNIYSSNYNAELEGFETNNICVNNVEINVGDTISILGPDIIFNTRTDGSKSIVFTHSFYDCCPIIITFNQDTNIIAKIEYIVFS